MKLSVRKENWHIRRNGSSANFAVKGSEVQETSEIIKWLYIGRSWDRNKASATTVINVAWITQTHHKNHVSKPENAVTATPTSENESDGNDKPQKKRRKRKNKKSKKGNKQKKPKTPKMVTVNDSDSD